MGLDSTILTIGTALRRAEQAGSTVDLLVQGQWISGRVIGHDGHGVVLANGIEESAVVRLELVAAVRVLDQPEEPVERADAGEERVHHMGPVPEDRQLLDNTLRWVDHLPVRV